LFAGFLFFSGIAPQLVVLAEKRTGAVAVSTGEAAGFGWVALFAGIGLFALALVQRLRQRRQ
jgi:MYXO-CTERM domain-containing protein